MAAKTMHTFRCDEQVWQAAQACVAGEGRTVTDVLTAALEALIAEAEAQGNGRKRRKAG